MTTTIPGTARPARPPVAPLRSPRLPPVRITYPPPARRRSRPPAPRTFAPLGFAGALLILIVLLLYTDRIAALPAAAVARWAMVTVVLDLVLVIYAGPLRALSCSSVYMVALVIFHFGVIVLLAVDHPLTGFAPLDFSWLGDAPPGRVITLAMIGTAAAAAGCCLPGAVASVLESRGRHRESPEPPAVPPPAPPALPPPAPPARDAARRAAAGPVGLAVLTVSIVLWIEELLSSGGLGILFGSYSQLLTVVNGNQVLSYVDFGVGIGLALLVAGGPTRSRRAGLILFGAFSLVALPLGIRGTVMFPALAAVAIAARHRRIVRGWVLLVLCVATLSLIGTLREVRETGLADLRGSVVASPVDGLAEMGSSIHPLVEVVAWRDLGGEPAARGETYVVELQRSVGGRLLGRPQPPAESDQRIFNVLIDERSGAIGGSPIAEAYYNFGIPGIVGVMGLVGLVLGLLDRSRGRRLGDLGCAVVLVPLLIAVRNDSTPLLFQFVVGACLVGAVGLLERAGVRAARNARAGGLPTAVRVGGRTVPPARRPSAAAPSPAARAKAGPAPAGDGPPPARRPRRRATRPPGPAVPVTAPAPVTTRAP